MESYSEFEHTIEIEKGNVILITFFYDALYAFTVSDFTTRYI